MADEPTMECGKCGNEVAVGTTICPECGSVTEARTGQAGGDRLDLEQSVVFLEDEEKMAERRPSFLNWLGKIIIAVFVIIGGAGLTLRGQALGFFVMIVGGLYIAYLWMIKQSIIIIFTNKRVIRTTLKHPVLESLIGVSERSVHEVWISNVKAMSSEEGLTERLLSAITGKTLGSIKLDYGSGVLSYLGAGSKYSIYEHQEAMNAIRSSRNQKEPTRHQ